MRVMKRMIWPATVLLLLLLTIAGCAKKQESLQELLNLGQRYLLEGNYEQAVVTFEKAIVVDEKNVEAYIGLADAYAGKGNSDKVKEVLKAGYEKTGDPILLDKEEAYSASVADETGEAGGTKEPAAGGTSGADAGEGNGAVPITAVEPSPELQQILSILESGDPFDAFDLLQSEAIKSLVDSAKGPVLLSLTGAPLNGEGTGMGIYYIPEAELYGVYRGSYSAGKRSGQGSWVVGHGHFEGQWADDAPNGMGKMVYSGGMTNEGRLSDGKWDGEMVQVDGSDGRVWHFNFTDGIPVTLGVDEEAEGEYKLIMSREYEAEDVLYMCSEKQASVPWGIMGFVPFLPD